MNKQEYLESIRSRISAMPADDVNRFMDYYSEMIDDRVEDGLSEEEAVADMGSPDAAVEQILEDMPLTKLVKEKIKPKHELKAWEVVLIVLGSPVWIPLLITAAVLLLTLWIVAFAFLISFSIRLNQDFSYIILCGSAQLCGCGNRRIDMYHTSVRGPQPLHSSSHARSSTHRSWYSDIVCCIG